MFVKVMTEDASSDVTVPHVSTEEFKYAVQEYVRIGDQLTDIRKTTSELNKKKKKVSEIIVSFMKEQGKSFCNLGSGGSLEMKATKSTLALKKDQISQLLQQLGNSEENAKETAEFLWSNKETRSKFVVKRNTRPID